MIVAYPLWTVNELQIKQRRSNSFILILITGIYYIEVCGQSVAYMLLSALVDEILHNIYSGLSIALKGPH